MKRKLIALTLAALLIFSSVTTLAAVENEGNVIYVSPKGSDMNEGTIDKPLKSLKAAKEKAATMDNNQPLSVVFRGGFYYINEPVEFSLRDSGTEEFPVRYMAYEGEKPVFTSSTKLDVSLFEPVTDKAVLARIPEEARDYVLELDLTKLGIYAPDVLWDKATGSYAENWIDLYLNGKTQQVAQWPNGMMNYDIYSKPISAGSTSRTSTDGGSFEVTTPRIFRWTTADPDQTMTMGYFGNDYTYAGNMLKSVDTEKMIVNHTYGMTYGIISARTRRYKVLNLIEELDIPTEFFVDRKTEKLYYYPPYDLEGSDLHLSINNKFPLIRVDGAEYINFENLEFYGMHQAMNFANSSDIKILGCTFFGSRGVMIDFTLDNRYVGGIKKIGLNETAYTANCKNFIIDSCNFYDGNVGMLNTAMGDSTYLEKSNSYVRNCFFERSSLVNGNTTTVRMDNSCGVNFVNNSMHNLFFHAIDYAGNYAKIQYNEIYNATRDPHDAGVIYHWREFTARANDIAYNIIHDTDNKGIQDTSSGTVGIYSDGENSGNSIHHNILWNNGNPIHHNAGVTNDVSYNIMMKARRKGMAFTYLNYIYSADLRAEAIPLLVDIAPWWLEHFPELEYEIYHAQNIKQGSHNTTINYNISDSKDGSSPEGIATLLEYKNNVIIDPVKDTSMFVDYDNNDFRLKAGTEFAKDFPDALTDENFDYAWTGVQVNDYRKTLPYFNEENSPFYMTYPRNGQSGIYTNEAALYWENARGADRYTVTIAKDKEMTDIVESTICENNYLEHLELEDNTTYYWTVEAENYSVNSPSKWKSISGVHSFSTGKSLADTTLTVHYMERMISDLDKIVEGTKEGEFPQGSKQKIIDAVESAKKNISKNNITQEEVDEELETLKKIHSEVAGSMYIKTVGISDMMPDKMNWRGLGIVSTGSENPMKFEYDEENGILKMTAMVDNQSAITDGLLSDKVVRKYRMRINWNGARTWMIFGEKVNKDFSVDPNYKIDGMNAEGAGFGWNSNSIVVTGDFGGIEIHNRANKSTPIIETVTNNYVKDGEWFDLEMGSITTLTGDRYIVRMNGKELFNKPIENFTIGEPGKFYVCFPVKGMSMEIQNPDGFTESEPYMMVAPSGTVEAGKELKVFDIENKTAKDSWRAGVAEVETGADFVRAKAIDQKAKSSLIYNAEEIYNSIVNFDTNFKELTYENPFVISMRATNPDGDYISRGSDNYYFTIKPGYAEIFRTGNNSATMIAKIKNNGIYKANERTNIQAATVDCEGGTRVVLEINGTRMIDVIDPNTTKESGYLAFWSDEGKEIEILKPSMPPITLDEVYLKPYVESGALVVTQQQAKKSAGEWTESGVGVNGAPLACNNQKAGPAALEYELKAPNGIYDVYYWAGNTYTGDENVKVTIISPYDGLNREFIISNRYSEVGWLYMGTYTTTDEVIRAKVEGSGEGDLRSGGFKLIKSTDTERLFSRLVYENKGSVVLNTGKKMAFVNGQPTILNTEPVVVNGRTMVPIRFISEAFGATVKWDNATSSATINADGHTLVFKLNQTAYTVDGTVKQLEQPLTTTNGRMMLPIRVISEDLGKNVYWEETNSGLIIINDKEIVVQGLKDNIQAAINYYLQ